MDQLAAHLDALLASFNNDEQLTFSLGVRTVVALAATALLVAAVLARFLRKPAKVMVLDFAVHRPDERCAGEERAGRMTGRAVSCSQAVFVLGCFVGVLSTRARGP